MPILPTIHLNGTSAECLRDGYNACYLSLLGSLETLTRVEFNARDYYPQGPDAFAKARKEREEHFRALTNAAQYCLEIAIHADEAIDAKKRQDWERQQLTATV